MSNVLFDSLLAGHESARVVIARSGPCVVWTVASGSGSLPAMLIASSVATVVFPATTLTILKKWLVRLFEHAHRFRSWSTGCIPVREASTEKLRGDSCRDPYSSLNALVAVLQARRELLA